jgi:hypothetical protein
MSGSFPDCKLSIYALCGALSMLNSAVDYGKASGITPEEVYAHTEIGDLVEHLQDRLGIQFSGVRPGVEQNKYFIEELRYLRSIVRGREGRKLGAENNGICVLIAYITEIIQSGRWDLDSIKFYGQP